MYDIHQVQNVVIITQVFLLLMFVTIGLFDF